jgi:Cu2+-exporting ATPase
MLVAHQVYVVAINALLLKRTKLAGIKSTRPQSTPAVDAQASSGVST